MHYLAVFRVGALGDDRGAMLQSPPQKCLSCSLAVLCSYCRHLLVLNDSRTSVRMAEQNKQLLCVIPAHKRLVLQRCT